MTDFYELSSLTVFFRSMENTSRVVPPVNGVGPPLMEDYRLLRANPLLFDF